MSKRKPIEEHKPTGRPSIYTPALGEEICRLIADGHSLRKICERSDMPDRDTVRRWCDERPGFYGQYRKARQDQADSLMEEGLEKARSAKDAGEAACANVMLRAVMWAAGKLKPKVYGDKVGVEVSGPEGKPIEQKVVKSFDYDELARELAAVQRESAGATSPLLSANRN